jgi:Domain of unknown function (DUF5753)
VLVVLRVTGEERGQLLQLARDAADPNWVVPGVAKQLAALIQDEEVATHIVNVQPLVIPGLLQTEDYRGRGPVRAAGVRERSAGQEMESSS